MNTSTPTTMPWWASRESPGPSHHPSPEASGTWRPFAGSQRARISRPQAGVIHLAAIATMPTSGPPTKESSGATSYHLRALAKHDLIREVDDRGSGRERWWERTPGGISFTNPDAVKTPAGKAATQVIMTEFLNRRHRQLMRYVNETIDKPDSLKENALISTATLHMTYEQTLEFIEELQAVIDAAGDRYRDQKGDDVAPISVRADIIPLPEERL